MATKKKQTTKPKESPPTMAVDDKAEFKAVSLDLIDDPEQPLRTDLTPASVEELVLSIKQVGIIEPIVVKPVKGRYEVIAGHRRVFACRIAKHMLVPCYIRHASEEETEMLKIHENLYRADITPADEALHFEQLINKQKLTPGRIAQLISKSQSYVSDRLAILNYPDFLMEAMQSKEISFSVAREFARFDDVKQMRSAVFYAKRGGMTQEMAHKWVADHKRSSESPTIHEAPQETDDGEANTVEHSSTCVYCREPVRLMDAEVVYMHRKCKVEADAQAINSEAESPPEISEVTKP